MEKIIIVEDDKIIREELQSFTACGSSFDTGRISGILESKV